VAGGDRGDLYASQAGGRVEDIVALADDFLDSSSVVSLGDRDDRALRRHDGTPLPAGRSELRYTTPEMLAVEQRVVDAVLGRCDEQAGVAVASLVHAAIGSRVTMSVEQAAMVHRVCSSGAGVDVVEGLAESGKTSALAAALEAWAESGFTVSGVCLAAKAAQRLQDGSGIPSTTLDSFLVRLERADDSTFGPMWSGTR
jgi:hypothetical protein